MNDSQPARRDITDETFIPNLAANALPITPLLVAMIEHVHPIGMRGMRLRDAWLSLGAAGPEVNFTLNLGGDLRGGPNGNLWARLRAHPNYLSDADLEARESEKPMKGLARVTFLVPLTCAKTCYRLITNVPYMTESTLEKYRAGVQQLAQVGDAVPKQQMTITPEALAKTLKVLAVLVESLRTTTPEA